MTDTLEAYKDGKYIFPNDEASNTKKINLLVTWMGGLTLSSGKQTGSIYSTTSSASHLATASSSRQRTSLGDVSTLAPEPVFGRWSLRTTSQSAK